MLSNLKEVWHEGIEKSSVQKFGRHCGAVPNVKWQRHEFILTSEKPNLVKFAKVIHPFFLCPKREGGRGSSREPV